MMPADPATSIGARPDVSGPGLTCFRRRGYGGGGLVANARNRNVWALGLEIGGGLPAGSNAEHGIIRRHPRAGRVHDPEVIDSILQQEPCGERASGGGADHHRQGRSGDCRGHLFDRYPRPPELTNHVAPACIEHSGDMTQRVPMYGRQDRIELVMVDQRHENIAFHEKSTCVSTSHLRPHLTIPGGRLGAREGIAFVHV